MPILKGVDLDIRKGEIVSIVGPSGSGKSTLLHILGTLDQADQGSLVISGETISAKTAIMEPAAWWKRALNLVVDILFIGAITWTYRFFVPALNQEPEKMIWIGIGAATAFVYYFLAEWLLGRTVGKIVTGTRVYAGDGPFKPGAAKILTRTLTRYLPFTILEGFSFLSANPRGWHDTASDTIVADSRLPYIKNRDRHLSNKPLAKFRNEKIGFIFQFHHLLPEFTALENVCIPAWIQGKKKSATRERAEELLKLLGLQDRMHHKPNELSGGEQQRVAVARALINDPDIVFADEPTGNLDSANARELHQLFFDLRNRLQQTFLIVTHNEELALLSDRIVHMKDGKVL